VRVCEHSGKAFRKQIGLYVDSNKRREDISTWPLVRVCRIRHNWPVLATGAMLVDLPGVRDANAARGRVAETYLKASQAYGWWGHGAVGPAQSTKPDLSASGTKPRRMGAVTCLRRHVCSPADSFPPALLRPSLHPAQVPRHRLTGFPCSGLLASLLAPCRSAPPSGWLPTSRVPWTARPPRSAGCLFA
jgi:hypothetical protein